MTDRLGSVTDVVDSNGVLRIHREFDAFGNITAETHYNENGTEVTSGQGFVTVAFAYTGRLWDETTGLQNNLNRWYDPAVGRWIGEDPIGFLAGDPNLNRYVGNGPTGWVDPGGWDREWVLDAPHSYLRVEINGYCYELHYSILGAHGLP